MNRNQIAELLPQKDDMMLLDRLVSFDGSSIVCISRMSGGISHPLCELVDGVCRQRALNTLEYAAQTIALHGILKGRDGGPPVHRAYIAGLQNVHWRSNDIAADDWPLRLEARALGGLGDAGAKYAFWASGAAGDEILCGEALVMISDTPDF